MIDRDRFPVDDLSTEASRHVFGNEGLRLRPLGTHPLQGLEGLLVQDPARVSEGVAKQAEDAAVRDAAQSEEGPLPCHVVRTEQNLSKGPNCLVGLARE